MPKDLSYAVSQQLQARESQPIILMQIGLSSTTLFYAAEKNNVTFNGNTYTAKQIMFGGYSQSAEGQINRVNISVDNTARDISAFAMQENFDGRPLVILRVFRNAMSGSTDYMEIFRGSMEETSNIKRPWFPITASSGKPLYQRALLEEYQRTCRRVFGDAECNGVPATEYTAIVDDDCSVDNTANWAQDGDTLTFDTDHYEFAATGADKKFYSAADFAALTAGDYYKVKATLKDGVAQNQVCIFETFTTAAGATIAASPTVTTTTAFVTETYSFRAVGTERRFGVKIISDPNGSDIEVKNIKLSLLRKSADLTHTDFYATGSIVSGSSKHMIIDPAVGAVTGTQDDAFNYGIIKVGKSGTTYVRTCYDWTAGTSRADWQVQLPVDVDNTYRYQIYKGCPKTIGACTMAYTYGPGADNQENYGGFIHIALEQERISMELPPPPPPPRDYSDYGGEGREGGDTGEDDADDDDDGDRGGGEGAHGGAGSGGDVA